MAITIVCCLLSSHAHHQNTQFAHTFDLGRRTAPTRSPYSCTSCCTSHSQVRMAFHWQSKGAQKSSGVEDMVLLTKISEDSIVENLKKYVISHVYLCVGVCAIVTFFLRAHFKWVVCVLAESSFASLVVQARLFRVRGFILFAVDLTIALSSDLRSHPCVISFSALNQCRPVRHLFPVALYTVSCSVLLMPALSPFR